MRTVRALALAAVVAACGGDDGNSNMHMDAGVVDSKTVDVPPDADLDIAGTWRDNYISASGMSTVPECNVAPAAVVVDPTTAATTPYNGACKADGSFRIMAPTNLGTYYLRIGTSFFETNKRAGIDLSTDHLGRSDVAGITGVSLDLNMTNLGAWTSGDVLMAFSPNIGYFQNVAFTTGGPAVSSTTFTGSAPWSGYKIDSAKQDLLSLYQLGAHQTTGSLNYTTLDRIFDVPAFTMANNTPASVAGAFTTATTGTLQLRVNVASFNQFSTVANPNTASKTIEGSEYAAATSDVIRSPTLISFAQSAANVTTLDFGTLSYSDPFPSTWQHLVRIQEAFQVPYTWNSVNGTMNATMVRILDAATANANAIDATLGPPVSPTFDDVDAYTATAISPVPKLSWSPPSFGAPTDYEIQVYEVSINGTALKFTSILKMTTKQTSVRIPAGFLLGQRQYVFSIKSRIRTGVDIYTTPLRNGSSSASAETLTALVTTNS